MLATLAASQRHELESPCYVWKDRGFFVDGTGPQDTAHWRRSCLPRGFRAKGLKHASRHKEVGPWEDRWGTAAQAGRLDREDLSQCSANHSNGPDSRDGKGAVHPMRLSHINDVLTSLRSFRGVTNGSGVGAVVKIRMGMNKHASNMATFDLGHFHSRPPPPRRWGHS